MKKSTFLLSFLEKKIFLNKNIEKKIEFFPIYKSRMCKFLYISYLNLIYTPIYHLYTCICINVKKRRHTCTNYFKINIYSMHIKNFTHTHALVVLLI